MESLFKKDLPEDILYLILVKFDGRFRRRNGIFIFKIDYRLEYYSFYTNLSFHYGNILKSKYIKNEIYNECIKNGNLENIVYIIS
jgi:hypothetical protein